MRWFFWWYFQTCKLFFSYTLDCLQSSWPNYFQLCQKNLYNYEKSKYIGCAFFKEIALHCGKNSTVWDNWRSLTQCGKWSILTQMYAKVLNERNNNNQSKEKKWVEVLWGSYIVLQITKCITKIITISMNVRNMEFLGGHHSRVFKLFQFNMQCYLVQVSVR